MRIVVTGSQGFLGKNFVSHIKSQTRVSTLQIDICNGAERIIDICTLQPLTSVLSTEDTIYHFAGIADSSRDFAEQYLICRINILGTLNICEAAFRVGAKVVLISSSWIYSMTTNPELAEHADYSHHGSRHSYSTSKVCAELIVKMYSQRGLRTTIIRPFNPYGPHMWKGLVIRDMLDKAQRGTDVIVFGDGSTRRSFVYTDDFCEALALVSSHTADGRTYDLCGPETTSMLELARKIGARFGVGVAFCDVPQRHGEYRYPESFTPKSEWTDFGWKPQISLDEGLERLLTFEEARPRG